MRALRGPALLTGLTAVSPPGGTHGRRRSPQSESHGRRPAYSRGRARDVHITRGLRAHMGGGQGFGRTPGRGGGMSPRGHFAGTAPRLRATRAARRGRGGSRHQCCGVCRRLLPRLVGARAGPFWCGWRAKRGSQLARAVSAACFAAQCALLKRERQTMGGAQCRIMHDWRGGAGYGSRRRAAARTGAGGCVLNKNEKQRRGAQQRFASRGHTCG